MIKKLQIKFILLAMSALLAVLVIIIAGINIANYNVIVREADQLLIMLSDNKGVFPKDMEPKRGDMMHGMSPELPYETRYFSVLLNESGAVVQAETGSIAAVDTQDAIYLAYEIESKKDMKGFLGNYRYNKYPEDAGTRIIFLDCGRKLDSFYDFLWAGCFISLGGYLLVSLLIVFFSSRIIRPLAESYEKQKRFITDAGHEIKTPLTIINADVDVLEMEFGKNEWLEDIQRQSKRLSALTRDLIYLARMEETENSIRMIEFPVSDVVSEAASSFQALAQTQGKTFKYDIQPMLSLQGDEKAIHQLVTILLDNALKYSPADGIVSLMLERQNKTLRLTVFNTTENLISNENLSMLFERFYRIDPSRNSQTGGYGIGLSVAKAIVTAHNGKLYAYAPDERSLRITALFPI